MKRITLSLLAMLFPLYLTLQAQEITEPVRQQMGQLLDRIAAREVTIGPIHIDSVATEGKELQLFANMNCSYIPFREENVAEIYERLRQLLPSKYGKITLITNGRSIEEQIPLALRTVQKGKGKRNKAIRWEPEGGNKMVKRTEAPWNAPQGLEGRDIACWQSHGWYYEKKLDRWGWQRARSFQTVEELYR